ncbi:hypothetical protein ABIA39_000325 [Nocardia sp. GAS34]|uniref:hypothetical protein n=1 Tax=unclassified Nocardia TaxID=2637762 RepID=UPI003D1E517B
MSTRSESEWWTSARPFLDCSTWAAPLLIVDTSRCVAADPVLLPRLLGVVGDAPLVQRI